jgi:hypothetical protein
MRNAENVENGEIGFRHSSIAAFQHSTLLIARSGRLRLPPTRDLR